MTSAAAIRDLKTSELESIASAPVAAGKPSKVEMKLHALEKFIEATETLLAFDLAHEEDRSEATSRERFYLELSQRCWELRAGNFRWVPSFQKRQ